MLARFSAVLLTLLLFFDITHASEDKIDAPMLATVQIDNSTGRSVPRDTPHDIILVPRIENQRLFSNNTSLSVGTLFQAYMSNDLDQRRLSEMYILGVIDVLEGSSWCGYTIASPDAIQEQAYIALENAAGKPDERAATEIESHFSKTFPCKGK